MTRFLHELRYVILDTSGSTAAEYALILAIIGSAVAISALGLGSAIGGSMNKSSNCIATAGASSSC